MSEPDDWQKRMKDEYRELGARIHRLDEKIESITFHDTSNRITMLGTGYEGDESTRTQLELLKAQEGAMEAYKFILGERARIAGVEL